MIKYWLCGCRPVYMAWLALMRMTFDCNLTFIWLFNYENLDTIWGKNTYGKSKFMSREEDGIFTVSSFLNQVWNLWCEHVLFSNGNEARRRRQATSPHECLCSVLVTNSNSNHRCLKMVCAASSTQAIWLYTYASWSSF